MQDERAPGPTSSRDGGRERSEPAFFLPPVVLALLAVMLFVHLLRAYALGPDADFWLIVHTAFVPDFYSGAYATDVWSVVAPFSYTLLHADFVHLGFNAVWLAAFGSPLANRLGAGRFLLFWAVTGLAAAGLHYALHPTSEAPLIGASGAISGMMGAAARFGFQSVRTSHGAMFAGAPLTVVQALSSRTVLIFLAVWMAANAFTGLVSGVPGVSGAIAWEAHVGGFVAGFALVALFLPRDPVLV